MTKLSIIVPVYNADKYLVRCIDSILNQTFSDFELILVDDGSKDKSGAICDEYADKDERVIVIHQENGGSVKARKTGYFKAIGEYVSFIDSDDWIEREMYETLFRQGDEADIIVSGYVSEQANSTNEMKNALESGVYYEDKLIQLQEQLLYNGKFYEAGIVPALWNKIFRREMLSDILMRVPEDIRMGDDAAVTYVAILEAKKIAILNEYHPYHYVCNMQSLSTSYDSYFFEGIEVLYRWLYGEFQKRNSIALLGQLSYYMLFLINIGVENEFFVTNGNTFRNKISKIKKLKKMLWIQESVKGVENVRLTKNICGLKKALERQSIEYYLIRSYIKRGVNKLCRMMKKN